MKAMFQTLESVAVGAWKKTKSAGRAIKAAVVGMVSAGAGALGLTASPDSSAAPIDVTALGTAVDLSTINVTIGTVFVAIITVIGFVWAGRKIIGLFRGA